MNAPIPLSIKQYEYLLLISTYIASYITENPTQYYSHDFMGKVVKWGGEHWELNKLGEIMDNMEYRNGDRKYLNKFQQMYLFYEKNGKL